MNDEFGVSRSEAKPNKSAARFLSCKIFFIMNTMKECAFCVGTTYIFRSVRQTFVANYEAAGKKFLEDRKVISEYKKVICDVTERK